MRKFTTLFLSLLVTISLFAQEKKESYLNFSKADHYILLNKLRNNKEVINKYIAYEENLKLLINSNAKSTQTDTLINGRKIIPVVFHIIHNYGAENISDEQIKDAVRLLNLDYNRKNTDTLPENLWPAFKSRMANCKIEFRLAKIDPDGNYTDGIQRHSDERTYFAYYDINHEYAWNPNKYLNIYSVSYIYPEGVNLPDGAAIGGMSVFPPSNPLTPMFTGGDTLADGVLIRHDGIGSIGTATSLMGMGINALNRTFTHELGHYFNLYHPFQNLKLIGGLFPNMGDDGCDQGSWLFPLDGDEVNDTPPVQVASQNTSLSCFVPGSRNTCSNNVSGYGDEPDMPENYMDYQLGYCTNIFTTGQLARINATMNTDRRELWSAENLHATGVIDTAFNPLGIAKADFTADKTKICKGVTVNFTEFSYNAAPATWEWSFPGGSPATSTDMNPSVTYSDPGVYSVSLTVTNAAGTNTFTKPNYIYVSDPSSSVTGNVLETFENTDLSSWIKINQDNMNAWEITDTAFYAGSKCLRISNFANNSAGSFDEIITPSYNLSTMSPANPLRVKFKLSYAAKKVPNNAIAEMLYGNNTADTMYDKLQVFYSLDCGNSWVQRWAKTGAQLVTAGLDSNSFAPDTVSQWREENFAVVPGVAQNTNVRLKFVFKSSGAQNLYIDNLQIGDIASEITDEEIRNNLDFAFYPNPMTSESKITFNTIKKGMVNIDAYDVLGRKLFNIAESLLEPGNHSFDLNKSSFGASGIYIIKMNVGDVNITRRIVVN